MKSGDSKTLTVVHSLCGARAVIDAVAAARSFAAASALPPESTARLAIVVEELIANLFDHGGVNSDERVELSLTSRGGEVMLTLEDPGHRFDPRGAPPPDDRPPERGGGAGLAIVAAWTRILRYAPAGGINRLELLIPIEESKEEAT